MIGIRPARPDDLARLAEIEDAAVVPERLAPLLATEADLGLERPGERVVMRRAGVADPL